MAKKKDSKSSKKDGAKKDSAKQDGAKKATSKKDSPKKVSPKKVAAKGAAAKPSKSGKGSDAKSKAPSGKASSSKASSAKADSGKAASRSDARSKVDAEGGAAELASGFGAVDAIELPKLAGKNADSIAAALRLPDGPIDMAELGTTALPVGPQSKDEAAKALEELGPILAGLQERLFAQSTQGNRRRALVVLQGMDTSGKAGVIEHALGLVDPGAVQVAAFKQPTAEELEHDFLWRIEKRVPDAGRIGVFDRSHYEDVLVVRVHDLVPKAVWSKRFAIINAFERSLAQRGVTVIKCFLHISKEVQAERLLARLSDPTKYWKYNPGDVDARLEWDAYQEAYAEALRKCSTVGTPWYVIPSDQKWYRNWAVARLLAEKLAELNPQYPPADYDIEAEKQRVLES